MANNRLFLYDPETKKAVAIAKSYYDGWFSSDPQLNSFFKGIKEDAEHDEDVESRIKIITENVLCEKQGVEYVTNRAPDKCEILKRIVALDLENDSAGEWKELMDIYIDAKKAVENG